ncbi:hypothetical protein MmiAt1_05190 [Methanimicrococcus sp. At1]|uniref:Uncharacterized protein n=1 Tax=Methanimicrococcus hacksteinii TaxID=3028293 RepID=A0ABU3VNJ0_9EURY|nr:hypothetical protein [Methanimicrococcus sp. At1]MDV0444968.1 hypothetical protein [Methanimicrococcus sp. At1]
MAEINKSIVLLLELVIAVGALLFLAGLYAGIFGWTSVITPELGVIAGAALVIICGFAMAFYYSKDGAEPDEKAAAAN